MTRDRIEERYTDAFGREQRVTPDVADSVVAAMGDDPDDAARVVVARPGDPLPGPGELTLEDGTRIGTVEAVPRDAPHGYHLFEGADGAALVITGPGRCHLPSPLRAWGWAIQLATTRSTSSWGIGDLGDLARLAGWAATVGAGFVAVGPIGAPNPGPAPEPSPYYPSTRRWWNPLHLDVEAVPRADEADIRDLAASARRLNEERIVDRARVAALKFEALERIWALGGDRSEFEAWRRERGAGVDRWATFVVLTERHGPGWRSWPEALRSPDGTAVRDVAAHAGDRVDFHAWVQSCLDLQLATASRDLPRIADMPVGVDPGGFDAWDWQEQLALDATVGAPPDRFNQAGQDWGLPPFVPGRLRAAAYRPFVETVRAQLRHAGGLRIDHVLGLFRLWCVPRGQDPSRGAYVRQHTDELLEIVALESERAGAIVVGEDLGTVPPGVRQELRRRRLLSTRLALFETRPPDRWPRQAFAAVTTHDLPTVAGVWSGVDLRDQRAAGLEPDDAGLDRLRKRLTRAAGVAADASVEEVTAELHRRLAAAPPALVAATLEDALGVTERPNLPGTIGDQRANWSIALPLTVDKLVDDDRVNRTVAALQRT